MVCVAGFLTPHLLFFFGFPIRKGPQNVKCIINLSNLKNPSRSRGCFLKKHRYLLLLFLIGNIISLAKMVKTSSTIVRRSVNLILNINLLLTQYDRYFPQKYLMDFRALCVSMFQSFFLLDVSQPQHLQRNVQMLSWSDRGDARWGEGESCDSVTCHNTNNYHHTSDTSTKVPWTAAAPCSENMHSKWCLKNVNINNFPSFLKTIQKS